MLDGQQQPLKSVVMGQMPGVGGGQQQQQHGHHNQQGQGRGYGAQGFNDSGFYAGGAAGVSASHQSKHTTGKKSFSSAAPGIRAVCLLASEGLRQHAAFLDSECLRWQGQGYSNQAYGGPQGGNNAYMNSGVSWSQRERQQHACNERPPPSGTSKYCSKNTHRAHDIALQGPADWGGNIGGSVSIEDEPPLLEELGIDFTKIYQKTISVLNPMVKVTQDMLYTRWGASVAASAAGAHNKPRASCCCHCDWA